MKPTPIEIGISFTPVEACVVLVVTMPPTGYE